MDLWQDMIDAARASLKTTGVVNATLVVGDGTFGLPIGAVRCDRPRGRLPRVPPPLADQLAQGGRLVQPIGPGGHDEVRLFEKHAGRLVMRRSIVGARFVRLYGKHGYSIVRAPAEP